MKKKPFTNASQDEDVPPHGVLAVPIRFVFAPDECSTEYLRGLLNGTFDGPNGPLTPEERTMAEHELTLRNARIP